jgi:hypothetical protein
MLYKSRILRKAGFVLSLIAFVLSSQNSRGQMAIFNAEEINFIGESRKDVYDQIMEAEWRIDGKTLHFGSGPIEVTPDEKMDTIFYRQKIKTKWDTIICQISKPGIFTFVYNECCGGFNVKDGSGQFIEAKVNFRIIGQKNRRAYLGTLGETGLIVNSTEELTLSPGCRSAMSPNIYWIALSEIEFCSDSTKCKEVTCLFEKDAEEVKYDTTYRILSNKFNFIYMPMSNDPVAIIYDRKHHRTTIR